MDAGHTYYEVPASVYTDLDAAWTAKKIPVLTGGLNSHTVGFSVVVAKQQDHFIFFYHGTNATQGGNDYHLFGRITSTGG